VIENFENANGLENEKRNKIAILAVLICNVFLKANCYYRVLSIKNQTI